MWCLRCQPSLKAAIADCHEIEAKPNKARHIQLWRLSWRTNWQKTFWESRIQISLTASQTKIRQIQWFPTKAKFTKKSWTAKTEQYHKGVSSQIFQNWQPLNTMPSSKVMEKHNLTQSSAKKDPFIFMGRDTNRNVEKSKLTHWAVIAT